MFTLAEDAAAVGVQAKWIDHLVSCGLRAARYVSKLEDKQLVLALSVPQRDYAAALIACGWVLGAQRPSISDPRTFLDKVQPGTIIRLATKDKVVVAKYCRIGTSSNGATIVTNEGTWCIEKIRAINVVPDGSSYVEVPCKQGRPEPGSLARMAGIDSGWDSWLVSLPSDLVVIGTRSWIDRELSSCICKSGDSNIGNNEIQTVLLPKHHGAAVWNTQILSHVDRQACLELPKTVSVVILDGSGAIKYLPDVQAKIVICILDRSMATESAEEFIVQYRNTRGVAISLRDGLGWKMPAAFEYMAFEVGL